MRNKIIPLALTIGVVWALSMLLVGMANLVSPDYGRAFLEVVASLYPGYHPGTGIGSVITGTLYALVDGALGGAIVAWIYYTLARRFPAQPD